MKNFKHPFLYKKFTNFAMKIFYGQYQKTLLKISARKSF